MKIILLFSGLLVLSQGYNILVLMPYDGNSHFEVFKELFEKLGEKGHNLTVISYRNSSSSKNIRSLWLEKGEKSHTLSLKQFGSTLGYYAGPLHLRVSSYDNCQHGLTSKAFGEFLRESRNITFDVVLAEFFITECFLGLVTRFNAPVIGLSSCALMPWQAPWFGVPSNPSYLQSMFGGFKAPMSFLSRVENTLLHLYVNAWYKFTMENPGKEFSKKYIGYEPADPHNTSLILVNSHHTIHGARPFTPNVVEVAGIHVDNRKPKKLPEDIEKWINNSAAGVIYFSLGSMVKGDTFPEEQRKVFLRAFAKFPQRVLWKWENDTMPDKPDNVMIRKWLPQFDILCHPNVKAFMSHGGLLGTIEAVHCGVPLIFMPQFGDQRHNSHAMVNRDAGVLLHLQSATEEEVTEALRKVLQPKTFRRAKELSELFRDRPLSPMDAAIYWVEHVAKYRGAPHMRSPAIDMPVYQYLLLDVISFLSIIALLIIYTLYVSVRRVLGLVRFPTKEAKSKLS